MAPLTLLLLTLLSLSSETRYVSARNGADTPETPETSLDLVRSSCVHASYPGICFRTLSSYTGPAKTPSDVAQAAVTVSMNRARKVTNFLSRIGFRKKGEQIALRDCLEQLSDSVEQLRKTLSELRHLRSGTFRWQMSNAETWVSAALTDEDTCLDGFREVDGKVRADVKRKVMNVAKAEKLGRPSTALKLYLYFHTKDHDGVTFLDSRVEKIVTLIHRRRIELTQSQPDTPIDETDLYLSVVERDDKGRTYGLGWTPSGSRADMLQLEELEVEMELDLLGLFLLLMSLSNFCEGTSIRCTHIIRIMQDHTLTQDQLREVQGQLRRMEQALMDRLGISFTPAPPRDVPVDDSETDDDLDD
ncbi:hypothetical protein Scep_025021 [Stephania cephalantha]|uniref:Pectinesterase inhibitor domain-containing protein n=1 Tax=Stephania cephalantha TaxID=152367 RepID=A0AAP0EYW6_9MAGN